MKKKRFTYQEQKDWEVIEDEIAGLEAKLEACESEILKAARDFVRLEELMKEKEELNSALEAKMERWMYLNELAEEIAAEHAR